MTTRVCDKSEELTRVVKQPDAKLTSDELAGCDIIDLCQALLDRSDEISNRPDFAEAILNNNELTSLAEKHYERKLDYTDLDQLRQKSLTRTCYCSPA